MAHYDDHLPRTFAGKISIRRIPLNAGGYEYGRYGKYWGIGAPLWKVVGFDEEGWETGHSIERASSKDAVMAMYPYAIVRGQRLCRIHEDCLGNEKLAEACHAERTGKKVKASSRVHFASTSMRNNAGISFPACQAGARLLDMEKTAWTTTGDVSLVTCLKCRAVVPWYSRGKLPSRNPTNTRMTMAQDINVKSNPEERTLGSSVILGVVIGGLLGLGVGYLTRKAAETVGAALDSAGATKENHMVTTIMGSTPLSGPKGTVDAQGFEMPPYTENLATYLKRIKDTSTDRDIGPGMTIKTEGPFSGDELASKMAALSSLVFGPNSKVVLKPGEKILLGIVESDQAGDIKSFQLNNMGVI